MLAQAQCTQADRCSAISGSFDDCVTSNAYECCSGFDDCDDEAYAELDTLDACAASIRSTYCGGQVDTVSCNTLVTNLLYPPIDPTVIDEAFCAAVTNQQATCDVPFSGCEYLVLAPYEEFPECAAAVRTAAECLVERACVFGVEIRCWDEMLTIEECKDDVCDCGEGCVSTDPRCPAPRVFATDTMAADDFGGTVAGADAACQEFAEDAHLGGTWRALIGTQDVPVSERIRMGDYVRIDGAAGLSVSVSEGSLNMVTQEDLLFGASGEPIVIYGEDAPLVWLGAPEQCDGSGLSGSSVELFELRVGVLETVPLSCALAEIESIGWAHILCLEQ